MGEKTPRPGGATTAALRQQLPLLGAAAVISFVGLLVYGRHVLRGGFAADDWVDYSRYLYHPGTGFWAAVAHHPGVYRPVWAVISDLDWALMGAAPGPHLAQNLAIAVIESVLLFAVARRLGTAAVPALAMGLLLLLFPDADATRLFATDAQNALASLLLLAGLLAGVRGTEQPSIRGAWWGVAAILLYTLSILDYELTAPTAVLAGALCVLLAWRRRSGWPAWAGLLAVEVIVVAALLVHRAAGRGPTATMAQDIVHAGVIARQAVVVATRAAVPLPGAWRPLALPLAAGIVVLAAALSHFAPGAELRARLRHDLAAVVIGLLAVASGYVMIVPGASGYMPDSSGMQNRINAVAAVGFAVAVVAVLSLGATLVTRWLPRHREAATVVLMALTAGVGAGYGQRTTQHAANWDRAAAAQAEVLTILDGSVPGPRDGLTVFAFGRSGFVAPSIPIFGGGGMGDLVGALRVTWRTATVRGYPVDGPMHVFCEPEAAVLEGILESRAPYGRVTFVDLKRATSITPRTAAECRAAADASLPYAPVNMTEVSDSGG